MLKIKDNVDLKELEKYGFYDNKYSFANKNYSHISTCGEVVNRMLIHKDRHIRFNNPTIKCLDGLYDLIKDGLVEKVN